MAQSRWARALAVVAVIVLPACGGARSVGGPSQAVELESLTDIVPDRRGRRCDFVMETGDLPSFDELVRIGTRGSLSLWGRGAGVGDSVELSIRYDDQGRLVWVHPLHATMEAGRVSELARLVRSALEEDGPEDWGVRIRFVAGDLDAVLSSVLCDPVRSGIAVTRVPLPVASNREMAELYAALGRRITLRVALDEKGRVLEVEVPYTSGSRLLDQHAADVARSSTYEPKLHDGIAVPSVLSFSLRYPRLRT